jgi:hypothetical protein
MISLIFLFHHIVRSWELKGSLSRLQIAITAALRYDSYLVMRHGAGPGTRCGGMDDQDALSHQRLGCCFCSDTTSLVNVYQIKTYICGNVLPSFILTILTPVA